MYLQGSKPSKHVGLIGTSSTAPQRLILILNQKNMALDRNARKIIKYFKLQIKNVNRLCEDLPWNS